MLAAMTHPSRVLNLDMKVKLCMPKSYILSYINIYIYIYIYIYICLFAINLSHGKVSTQIQVDESKVRHTQIVIKN